MHGNLQQCTRMHSNSTRLRFVTERPDYVYDDEADNDEESEFGFNDPGRVEPDDEDEDED